MAGSRKKRIWWDDEKRSICLQTAAPGVSVAQVARRYAMNANLIFKWLKDPRFAPDFTEVVAASVFLPVEILRLLHIRSRRSHPVPAPSVAVSRLSWLAVTGSAPRVGSILMCRRGC